MKMTQLRADVSAYCFALAVTLVICLLAAGLLYIDLCANDTILSAKGVLYPYMDRLIGFVDERIV